MDQCVDRRESPPLSTPGSLFARLVHQCLALENPVVLELYDSLRGEGGVAQEAEVLVILPCSPQFHVWAPAPSGTAVP